MSRIVVHPENSPFYKKLLSNIMGGKRFRFEEKDCIKFNKLDGSVEYLYIIRDVEGILVTDRKDYFAAIEWSDRTNISSTEIFEIYHQRKGNSKLH